MTSSIPKSQIPTESQIQNPKAEKKTASGKPFDLRVRTFQFARRILALSRRLPSDETGEVVRRQLVRAGTSVGANVEEADGCDSKRDFRAKIAVARKEARELRFWLRLIEAEYAVPCGADADESTELIRIFSAMIRPRPRPL